MNCPSCGSPNEPGRKFCGECGTALAQACPRCGTPNAPGVKFCGECGLDLRAAAPQGEADPAVASHSTERRLVSVLFVDLVGFTTASEERDAEDTREFLGRYFEAARTIIERYGGTVEKFIGDAVMAVWGAPVAHEDDAERAVRAGLDIVAAIPALDETRRTQGRAGVLTGEAAVTVGAIGQGIVTGDLVNTASRLQSVAEPGTVYVGEATYRAASKSIAFDEAGEQQLKGKAAPVTAWRATSVVSRRGGEGRSEALEPPFVGRDEEVRLLKDLFHATERERKARLVSVVGQGGIGKSRLAWELEKYLDGVVGTVYWHSGRSPAYGEGIGYWALAEMVRQRAGIAEADDEAAGRAKLRETLTQWLPDPVERAWVEPRLAGLLALAPMPAGSRPELFAAWRTLFERMAAQGPTVLLFEDLQWADQGLLDFIDHLLDASRNAPFFVLTLARPELMERRPGWGSSARSATTMQLEPLARKDVEAMIRGLIPDIPRGALDAIVERSEGIPLYAVETLRMLIDRGQLVRSSDGERWELVGPLDQLAVPETLQALIASRLDALDADDRGLLQKAAVLGQSFTVAGLAGMSGDDPTLVTDRLATVVRRDVLRHEMDPRSPERGQYQFVQGIVREVAYSGLSRADRRALHLAAARHFESLGEEELSGVLASHYMEAHAAAHAGAEADALAVQARIALRAAADRAFALHSYASALGYVEQALHITPGHEDRAALELRASVAAMYADRYDAAVSHADAAIAVLAETADEQALLRARTQRAAVEMSQHRDRTAVAMLREALAEAADLPASIDHARAEAELGRALMIQGSPESVEWLDRVLASPATRDEPSLVLEAIISKGPALIALGRWREMEILLRGAIEMAVRDGNVLAELRARNNIMAALAMQDVRLANANARDAYELANRLGAGTWSGQFMGLLLSGAFEVGDFDGWIEEGLEATAVTGGFYRTWVEMEVAGRKAFRGETDEAQALLQRAKARVASSAQAEQGLRGTEALIALASGRYAEAFDVTRPSWSSEQGATNLPWAIAAALLARDAEGLAEAMTALPSAQTTGNRRRLMEAVIEVGLELLRAPGVSGEARVDLRRRFLDAFEIADALGLLLWRALLGIALGTLASGRFPEADAVAAEGEEFLRARGAGPVVDRFLESIPATRPAARAATQAGAPAADELVSER